MLRSFFKYSLVLGLALGMAERSFGFSLLGPYSTNQVQAIGYQLTGDIGGPMLLHEGYRWNSPVITYAYDASFLYYFGSNGVVAIEKAMKILNDLPAASQISPTELSKYPTDTQRLNYRASSLGLLDIKSIALGVLLEELGLASPDRWVWALQSRTVRTVGNTTITNYVVVKKNYDPITITPSSYVNGTLYTYRIREFTNPDYADAVEFPVDPLAISFTAVASLGDGSYSSFAPGGFYTGLTRDDVGGIRWLYHRSRFSVESAPVGITNGFLLSGSPWNPALYTNSISGGTGGISLPPWTPIGTNIIGTNAPGGGGTGTATNFVVTGLRPGQDKLTFVRVNYDSLLGQTFAYTNEYRDIVVTNGVMFEQTLQRYTTAPDIVFVAGDLGLNINGIPIMVTRTATANWQNNGALNSLVPGGGPGVIQGPVQISFSSVAPFLINQTPSFLSEANSFRVFAWGHFDGSTNPPIAFPENGGETLRWLEQQVGSGN